jgi:hypothetical protein
MYCAMQLMCQHPLRSHLIFGCLLARRAPQWVGSGNFLAPLGPGGAKPAVASCCLTLALLLLVVRAARSAQAAALASCVPFAVCCAGGCCSACSGDTLLQTSMHAAPAGWSRAVCYRVAMLLYVCYGHVPRLLTACASSGGGGGLHADAYVVPPQGANRGALTCWTRCAPAIAQQGVMRPQVASRFVLPISPVRMQGLSVQLHMQAVTQASITRGHALGQCHYHSQLVRELLAILPPIAP